jgi:hypothetical protein
VVRRAVTLAVFDLLTLGILYLVSQDLAWRTSYPKSETPPLSLSTAYSLFVRTFRITGSTIQIPNGLVGPPALDWVQVLVASLIVVNGLYVLSRLRRSSKRGK